MRRILLLMLPLIPVVAAHAQTNEVAVQVSSGFFSYGGKSATDWTNLYISDLGSYYSVNTPFGTKSALSYGLSIQLQHVTKKRFIVGMSGGYDQLAAKTNIESAQTMGGNNAISNGKARLTTHSVRLNPYFGYRVPIQAVKLDFTAGFNVNRINKSDNYVTFDGQGDAFEKKTKETKINTKFDFGPMAGLAISYKRLAVSASYTYGLINYQRMMTGANPEVYSRYLRLGLSYRIF